MSARSLTRIDLIRHGEPRGGRRIRGQSDDPLSDLGWQQMWNAVGNAVRWDVIVASPLSRCRDFAQALAERTGLPFSVEPRFMERAFGEWEGRTHADIEAADPLIWKRYQNDPDAHSPPGAESLSMLSARVIAGWTDLLATHSGKRVLVVCHAGTIRAIIAHVLGAPPANLVRVDVAYAATARVRVTEGQPAQLVLEGTRD